MILFYQLDLTLYLILFFLFLYFLITRNYEYWKRKNIPHLKPSFLFGNYKDYILLKKHIGQVAGEICERFPDSPYVGTYYGTELALLLQDPELIKLVLIKDFTNFNGREVSKYTDKETMTKSLFFVGDDVWKILRQNLVLLFTTTKMRNMFYLIENCSNTFEKIILEEFRKSPVIETKMLTCRFTMDCVFTCVFGINPETMINRDESHLFLSTGEKFFSKSKWRSFKLVIRSIWPIIFYKCGLKLFDTEVHQFLHKIIIDAMKTRENSLSLRHDFVDLLRNWKMYDHLKGTSLRSGIPLSLKVTDDLLVSQCALFFGAGFDTSSAALAFLMFELAKNKSAQLKVIDEVDAYLAKISGKVTYECINELPYLEACLKEVMRLYPLFGNLTRETMNDYTFPTGLNIEKGVRIHIPIYHLHHSSKYFPEPELFRPERFLGEEKLRIVPNTYMPFGDGPRHCIGVRFSKMQMIPAILKIFKNFKVELADNMPTKLNFVPGALVTQADSGIYIKFISRRN